MGSTGILGGTFNPFHNGHMRHALEVKEALGLDRVKIMPCPDPPHKSDAGLLHFELRVALAEAALNDTPGLELSTLEGTLPHPSYTWQTLSEWRHRYPDDDPFFMMGAESFAALDKWYRGLELPLLAHIVMVPRAGDDIDLFHASIRKFWPGQHRVVRDAMRHGMETVCLEGGGECIYLETPRIDISSTVIRHKWREGKSLAGLLPSAEIEVLQKHAATVTSCWHNLP